ncbi:PEP-CTERM sorting domain-containing protein [Aphanothece sacrum]|uniref:ABC transporter ATP-binding protein n=1 Tax=Aphanothece sacrum FPU1 TaxID=1920663 RepID=A0A401IEV4_APHSA|nr:PEP-CTERM sorting domain-containing protein [Aphanothece sacrum]GBF79798.1 ABC transporter ATP-binding protein [Aphanothece sacrum FPU1]GBF84810.1 ABC transporter ATP-binding protein [Aphanothece sacrum FPU3]
MGDIRNDAVGITSSNISLFFNPNQLQNIDNSFTPTSLISPLLPTTFPLGRTGILNNNNGSITNLGGASLPSFGIGSPLGINQLETFSLMYFKAINSGDSSLSLNIDLSQTGFADGTFVSLTTPNQFTQPISITPEFVPEPLTILGVITASVFGVLLKTKGK